MLLHVVLLHEIREDLGRKILLAREGTAGSGPDDDETERDDEENGRDETKHTPDDETGHTDAPCEKSSAA